MKHILLVLAFAIIPIFALAQNFAGNYSLQDPQGTTTLVIRQGASGKVRGTITMDNGAKVDLEGDVKGSEVIGIATIRGGKGSLFKLHFQGAQLIYTMIAVTADNKPDLDHAQQFPFTRQGGGGSPSAAVGGSAAGQVSSGGFSGEYAIQTNSGPLTLSLHEDASGRVTGTMMDTSGGKYTLDGAVNAASGVALGILVAPNGTQAMFKVQPTAEGVGFAFTPPGNKNANLDTAQVFPFKRTGEASAGGGNPLAGGGGASAGDPFTGVFSDGNIYLELQGAGGQYQGQIEFQGQDYPLTAQSPDGRNLRGRFTTGSGRFDFTGSLNGATLSFVTGGTTYQLRREDDTAAGAENPLAGGAPAANPPGGGSAGYNPAPGGGAAGYNPAAGGAADGIQRNPMAPATPGRLSDNNPQSLQWLNHLRGKLLSRLSSYTSGTAGGYSSNERMLLYPNGQFEYYSSSSVSVQSEGPVYTASGSSGGQGIRRGTWRIVTAQGTSYLALVYEGTAKEEYAELDFRDNKTFIDGRRAFVTAPQ
jgi:hypothetical protein